MNADRHARVKRIFLAVLQADPGQHDRVLDAQCGEDAALRVDVEELLRQHTDVETQAMSTATAGTNEEFESVQFVAGQILGERYRIVDRLGEGGMGCVYRAEDMVLGQTVALKFLHPHFAQNPAAVARFRDEVRLARRVTHPNICRVYDLGRIDDAEFLSMEYVDGENLHALLRRIGRLPIDKALDIARQMCAGLAAAHGNGILHRDLKPANIMLDGRGNVRITDFGLAAAAEHVVGLEAQCGTPAYMAPEQWSGEGATARSDIYALGLVLYELFTGVSAIPESQGHDYAELHRSFTPEPPSQHVANLSSDVDAMVLACLQKAPSARPSSAITVSAGLPGGDLLSASIAAHVTPSPEAVAAVDLPGTTPLRAVVLMGIVLAALAGVVGLRSHLALPWQIEGSQQPDVLAERARHVLTAVGLEPGPHIAYGFCDAKEATAILPGYTEWMPSDHRLATSGPSELLFWFRASIEPLSPRKIGNVMLGPDQIRPDDPPMIRSRSAIVVTGLKGRLLLFGAVPDAREAKSPLSAQVEWGSLFEEAGLTSVAAVPARVRSVYATGLDAAWEAEGPLGLGTVHVEAVAADSVPLLFAVSRAAEMREQGIVKFTATRQSVVDAAIKTLLLVMGVVALPWAWINHRAGRGDTRGAARLFVTAFIARMAMWLLRGDHAIDTGLFALHFGVEGLRGLGEGALFWVFYIALEPTVRRHWPQILVSWSHVVSGRWQNPAIARHVLVGASLGVFWALIFTVDSLIVQTLGKDRPVLLNARVMDLMLGGRYAVAGCVLAMYRAVWQGLLFMIVLAALRGLTRRPRMAAGMSIVLLSVLFIPYGAHSYSAWLTVGLGGVALAVWVMIRYGVVALAIGRFVAHILLTFPMSYDPQQWTADLTLLVVGLTAAVLVIATWRAARTPA
jgi:serine/threonine-protein kinase